MTELVDAGLYASLKTTLVPTNGAGNPTFTRATTKNIFDNEGKLITVKSGAVAMAGARLAQNLLTTNSEDLTVYPTTGITHSLIAGYTRALEVAVSNQHNFSGIRFPTRDLREMLLVAKVRGNGRSYCYIRSNCRSSGAYEVGGGFYLSGAGSVTFSAAGWVATIELDVDGDYIISAKTTPLTAFSAEFILGVTNGAITSNAVGSYLGDITKGLDIAYIQVEDVTGQAIQTAGEYVSVGVLSSPYHGGGADGVKYFDTDSSGVAIPDATMLGAHIDPASKTNNLLWCRDLTNAAWVKTNATAAKTQTGIDAVASSCSLLTAAAANATILQTITAASTPACSGFWVKRSIGTGSIFFTRNGGTDWLDITSLINSSTFTCVKIENTSVTNPQVGFKIATSGDAIIVDAGINHAGTTLTLPILTTSAAVTRAADVLTYQTASNFSDTAGTILATYKPTYDTYASGSIVGSSTRGLYAGTSNSGVQALDGTNTINGPSGTPSGQIKIGARWSGSSLQCFALDSFGSSGSYDGSFNLSTIGILPGTAGYIRDLAIWTSSLTDVEIRDAWNLITIYITSGSLVGMQSILSSSTSSISTVIYGTITATYVQPTLTATYTVPTIEAKI